jgi:uncharacterized membrane protein YczE
MAWSPARYGLLGLRLVQLYVGLLCYGLAGALQVRSGLGLDPWDVLHQGISRHTGLAIGTVVIVVGAAVLLLWIPLRQWPGLGTASNVVLIGVSMNLALQWLPHPHAIGWRIFDMVFGVALCGVATGMYIGADFGPGPRDGLMTGFARRSGRSIRLVRTGIEVTVLAVGWSLGGTVGVGTVLFAVAIGPLTQLLLPLFAHGRVRDQFKSSGSGPVGEENGQSAHGRVRVATSRARGRTDSTLAPTPAS